jgi:hypothetical protein
VFDQHPALDRPLVAAIVKLARRHRPHELDELGMGLLELGFVGRPGFFAGKSAPNIPEESAYRWLALLPAERSNYHHRDGRFLQATWIANWLTELLREALHTGEACLVGGPEAVTDSIEFADGQLLRAVRVDIEPPGGPIERAPSAEEQDAKPRYREMGAAADQPQNVQHRRRGQSGAKRRSVDQALANLYPESIPLKSANQIAGEVNDLLKKEGLPKVSVDTVERALIARQSPQK